MQPLQEDRHEDLQRAVGDRHQQDEPQAQSRGRAERESIARQQRLGGPAVDPQGDDEGGDRRD